MKGRILLVDDEPFIRDAVGILLRSRGYEVVEASTGEAGIEEVGRTSFQLALLDLMMPGIGGLDALPRMKTIDPDLPVIVFTGYAEVESAKAAMARGAADYVPKPVETGPLLERIRKHLRKSPGETGGSVLVVDDDPQVLQSILATLEEANVPAKGVSQGSQALVKAARGEGQVLLTDLNLADMGGIRIIASLRKARPDMVTILMTGYASVETTVEALRQGAMDCLLKPVNPVQLVETVRRALEKSRREWGAASGRLDFMSHGPSADSAESRVGGETG